MGAILLETVLLPALVAGGIAVGVPRGRPGTERWGVFGLALALAAGILAASWGVQGRPVWPPGAAREWIPWCVAAVVPLAPLVRAALPAGRRRPAAPWLPGLPLTVVAAGGSLVLLMGYSASLAQIAAGVAAALGGVLAACLVRRDPRLGHAACAPAAWALLQAGTIAWRYTDAAPASILLLLGGWVLALAPRLARAWGRPVLPRGVLFRTALSAVFVAAAVLVSWLGYEPPSF